jgi:S-DNA-T family DNA segregation ATPase FtsK/SpoIIIE
MNILDHKGGESLLGKGDALLQLPDRPDPIRVQGAWITPDDIRRTVDYWRK